MADGYISAVQLPGDNTYDIKDKNAVTEIQIVGETQTKTNGVVNLPARVTQSNSSTTSFRPILTGHESWSSMESYTTGTVTDGVYKSAKAFLKTSNGTFYGGYFVAANPVSGGNGDTAKRVTLNSNGLYANNYLDGYSIAPYERQIIQAYAGKSKDANGLLLTVDSGGLTMIGGGESSSNLAGLIDNDQTTESPKRLDINNSAGASDKETTAFTGDAEQLILSSDNNIYFATNCQTPKNRVAVCLNNSRTFYPMTNNTGSIGSSSYKWANGYFTKINGVTVGNTPVFTDTTYTLSTGDSNGQIKVTPSSGNAYNVNVKGLGSNAYSSTAYLPLTGGTVTGVINIKSSNLDRDGKAPTDDQTGKSLYFVDKDDNGVGRIYTAQRKTNNKKDLFMSVYNASGTSNSIGIRILDDGTQSYYLSNPSAFRSAISAGSIRFLTLGDGNTAGTYFPITTDPASYAFTVPSDTKIVEFFYATNTGGGWGENIDSKRIPLSLLQSQSNTLVTLFLIGDKNWTHTYIRKRTYRITKISNYKYSITPNNESTDTYNHGATTDLVSTGTFTITKNDNAIDLYTANPIAVYVGY